MPNTYTLISSNVLASSAASVTFSAIPSTYTDLVLRVSGRSANVSNFDNPRITLNGSSSTFSRTEIYAESGAVGSERAADRIIGVIPAANATSNTFGSMEFYLPSYTSSTNKPYGNYSVTENNSTTQSIWVLAGLWSTTSAINEISISLQSAGNFVSGSSFYLYGISNS